MGVFGSLGINVGQNMQANGIERLPAEKRAKPFQSKLWRVGLVVFANYYDNLQSSYSNLPHGRKARTLICKLSYDFTVCHCIPGAPSIRK